MIEMETANFVDMSDLLEQGYEQIALVGPCMKFEEKKTQSTKALHCLLRSHSNKDLEIIIL